ncbi:UNVERIFIED_CONTAM: hypothetical protein HHA_308060 [Hammondia hammondi]|eukprot:XP_008889462.1 hypothetical protein HHA_308060 [Hammondia hammondi]
MEDAAFSFHIDGSGFVDSEGLFLQSPSFLGSPCSSPSSSREKDPFSALEATPSSPKNPANCASSLDSGELTNGAPAFSGESSDSMDLEDAAHPREHHCEGTDAFDRQATLLQQGNPGPQDPFGAKETAGGEDPLHEKDPFASSKCALDVSIESVHANEQERGSSTVQGVWGRENGANPSGFSVSSELPCSFFQETKREESPQPREGFLRGDTPGAGAPEAFVWGAETVEPRAGEQSRAGAPSTADAVEWRSAEETKGERRDASGDNFARGIWGNAEERREAGEEPCGEENDSKETLRTDRDEREERGDREDTGGREEGREEKGEEEDWQDDTWQGFQSAPPSPVSAFPTQSDAPVEPRTFKRQGANDSFGVTSDACAVSHEGHLAESQEDGKVFCAPSSEATLSSTHEHSAHLQPLSHSSLSSSSPASSLSSSSPASSLSSSASPCPSSSSGLKEAAVVSCVSAAASEHLYQAIAYGKICLLPVKDWEGDREARSAIVSRLSAALYAVLEETVAQSVAVTSKTTKYLRARSKVEGDYAKLLRQCVSSGRTKHETHPFSLLQTRNSEPFARKERQSHETVGAGQPSGQPGATEKDGVDGNTEKREKKEKRGSVSAKRRSSLGKREEEEGRRGGGLFSSGEKTEEGRRKSFFSFSQTSKKTTSRHCPEARASASASGREGASARRDDSRETRSHSSERRRSSRFSRDSSARDKHEATRGSSHSSLDSSQSFEAEKLSRRGNSETSGGREPAPSTSLDPRDRLQAFGAAEQRSSTEPAKEHMNAVCGDRNRVGDPNGSLGSMYEDMAIDSVPAGFQQEGKDDSISHGSTPALTVSAPREETGVSSSPENRARVASVPGFLSSEKGRWGSAAAFLSQLAPQFARPGLSPGPERDARASSASPEALRSPEASEEAGRKGEERAEAGAALCSAGQDPRAVQETLFPSMSSSAWLLGLLEMNQQTALQSDILGTFIETELVQNFLQKLCSEYERAAARHLDSVKKYRHQAVKANEVCRQAWLTYEQACEEASRDTLHAMSREGPATGAQGTGTGGAATTGTGATRKSPQCSWLLERKFQVAARRAQEEELMHVGALLGCLFQLQCLEKWRCETLRHALQSFLLKLQSCLSVVLVTLDRVSEILESDPSFAPHGGTGSRSSSSEIRGQSLLLASSSVRSISFPSFSHPGGGSPRSAAAQIAERLRQSQQENLDLLREKRRELWGTRDRSPYLPGGGSCLDTAALGSPHSLSAVRPKKEEYKRPSEKKRRERARMMTYSTPTQNDLVDRAQFGDAPDGVSSDEEMREKIEDWGGATGDREDVDAEGAASASDEEEVARARRHAKKSSGIHGDGRRSLHARGDAVSDAARERRERGGQNQVEREETDSGRERRRDAEEDDADALPRTRQRGENEEETTGRRGSLDPARRLPPRSRLSRRPKDKNTGGSAEHAGETRRTSKVKRDSQEDREDLTAVCSLLKHCGLLEASARHSLDGRTSLEDLLPACVKCPLIVNLARQLQDSPFPSTHRVYRQGVVERQAGGGTGGAFSGFLQKWRQGFLVLTWDRFLHMFRQEEDIQEARPPCWSICLARSEVHKCKTRDQKEATIEIREKRRRFFSSRVSGVFRPRTARECDEWMSALETVANDSTFFEAAAVRATTWHPSDVELSNPQRRGSNTSGSPRFWGNGCLISSLAAFHADTLSPESSATVDESSVGDASRCSSPTWRVPPHLHDVAISTFSACPLSREAADLEGAQGLGKSAFSSSLQLFEHRRRSSLSSTSPSSLRSGPRVSHFFADTHSERFSQETNGELDGPLRSPMVFSTLSTLPSSGRKVNPFGDDGDQSPRAQPTACSAGNLGLDEEGGIWLDSNS